MPNEIAGKSQVTMTLSTQVTETRTLQVTPINPAIFTGSDGYTLALNQDGSLNSENSPAKPGSIVTIFLTGIGVTNPPDPTGTINETLIPLNLDLQVPWGLVLSARAATGSFSGVWQITAQLPATPYQNDWVVLVARHPAREDVQLWVSW